MNEIGMISKDFKIIVCGAELRYPGFSMKKLYDETLVQTPGKSSKAHPYPNETTPANSSPQTKGPP